MMQQQLHIEDYVPGQRWKEYRQNTGPLKKVEIDTLPTCEVKVPISPYFYDTNKLAARILSPQQTQIEFYAEINGTDHTTDLIYKCLKKLLQANATPKLIMLSQLRYLAIGELELQPRYFYHDVHVPVVAAYSGCNFDVRVYGVTLQQ